MTRTILALTLLIVLISCNAEKSQFKQASEDNTIESYQDYLNEYKDGKYVSKALVKIEEIKFSQLRDSMFLKGIDLLKHTQPLNNAKIKVKPSNRVLMGTPVTVKLENLPADTLVTLSAYRRHWNGVLYSFASFHTDGGGKIDPAGNAPVCGTYKMADPLGIFWSMTWPFQNNVELPPALKELETDAILFCLEAGNQLIAMETLTLLDKHKHIVADTINNDTLQAVLHYPEQKDNMPLVILLSGAEGGYHNINKMAKIIASHDYGVLALAYFKIEPLQEHLEKIPLEYFFHALDWIKSRSNIDSNRIFIAGGSRGGELALLLASLRQDIKGVVAVEPSCVLWQGLPHSPGSVFFPKPAWTLNGRALPYLRHRLHLPTLAKFGTGAKQIELMKLYEGLLDDQSEIADAMIKVENINGPILLIAGKDGQMWPSYHMCQMIENRLDSLEFKHPVHHGYYEKAGHYVTITPDLAPTIGYKYEQVKVGGTNSGNAHAQLTSWNKVIQFLDMYLKS